MENCASKSIYSAFSPLVKVYLNNLLHTYTYIHTFFIFLFFQIKNTTCPRIAYASLGGSC